MALLASHPSRIASRRARLVTDRSWMSDRRVAVEVRDREEGLRLGREHRLLLGQVLDADREDRTGRRGRIAEPLDVCLGERPLPREGLAGDVPGAVRRERVASVTSGRAMAIRAASSRLTMSGTLSPPARLGPPDRPSPSAAIGGTMEACVRHASRDLTCPATGSCPTTRARACCRGRGRPSGCCTATTTGWRPSAGTGART